MKINKRLFDFILDKPSLLNFLLKVSNFDNIPVVQNCRNKVLAKAIEGIYSAGETLESAEIRMSKLEDKNVGVILNYAMEAGKTINFQAKFYFIAGKDGIKLMESEYHKILACLKNHRLSCVALKPTALISVEKILYLSELMKNENYGDVDLGKLLNNSELEKIAEPFLSLSKKAAEIGSKILIDAEQSNLQPGVDLLALYLMKNFNLNSRALIYNTYQLYLKDSPLRLNEHKKWLSTNHAQFAAKIVRGAYLTYEKNNQEQVHPNYRICYSKCEVDQNYNKLLRELVLSGDSALVVATHNIKSLEILKTVVNHNQSIKNRNSIEYAFLMGFGDKIEELAKGLRCLEYVPYGPTEVKIPYLIRRLEENISIFMNKK